MRTEKRIEKNTIRHSKKSGLIALLLGAATFVLPNSSSKENQEQLKSSPASPRNEDFDDDRSLGFVWEPAGGSFDHYEVWFSVNGSEYNLHGTTSSPAYTIIGEEDCIYTIKVCAVTSNGLEGPFSPESDRVKIDLTNPTKPEIAESQETETEDATTFTLSLSKLSYDRNFLCYQKNGGPYTEWTNTTENENTGFVYAFTQNDTSGWHILKIRGKDKAGRTGEYGSERVYVRERSFGNTAYLEALDSDSDGYSNLQELIAGTNPQDSNSFFYAEISNFSEGKIISWIGSPGKTYQVYRLDTGLENSLDNWMPVGPEIFVGEEREIKVLDKGVRTNLGFYKVGVR